MEKSVIDRLGFCRLNRIQIAFTTARFTTEKHFAVHDAENKIKNFTPYQFC